MLTESALKEALADLPDWSVEGKALVRRFTFRSYLEGIAFVNRVAAAAERANHHPDLEVGWRKVTVKLTTHSAGGITPLDIALAHEADRASRVPAAGDEGAAQVE
jgi:4a-hydroxytetrahydrobiopterin dehydratase